MMINLKIKEATKQAHQDLEKTVVYQLKNVRTAADYAEVLKNFYVYFKAIEQAIAPFITSEVLPDITQRRNSSYLRKDLEELNAVVEEISALRLPTITNLAQAFGALYVLEGSIMGGPYIVQMLKKYGMDKGFNFFSGYGEESGKMWEAFTTVLNGIPKNEADEHLMLEAAGETFRCFGEVFSRTEATM
ncbi:biliverdin-producing heme oxygenase [Sphingobacterium sp. LRF_L2]|uniref:biliverdin-producing heme oxygenase n=1 Tax=Sphingobacterium sp. LRF_L2 TaxID=3369421 RepID=UPI003F64073E